MAVVEGARGMEPDFDSGFPTPTGIRRRFDLHGFMRSRSVFGQLRILGFRDKLPK